MPYYSGFFEDANCYKLNQEFEGYGFLENVDVEGESFDLNQFLHGYCDEFAYFQAMKHAYNIVVWYEVNEETQQFSLIHAFNHFNEDGVDYYLDVRGITSDLASIQEEFEDYEYEQVAIFSDTNQFIKFMESMYQEYYRPLKLGEIELIDQNFGCYYQWTRPRFLKCS